jgi:hypothetical protein
LAAAKAATPRRPRSSVGTVWGTGTTARSVRRQEEEERLEEGKEARLEETRLEEEKEAKEAKAAGKEERKEEARVVQANAVLILWRSLRTIGGQERMAGMLGEKQNQLQRTPRKVTA